MKVNERKMERRGKGAHTYTGLRHLLSGVVALKALKSASIQKWFFLIATSLFIAIIISNSLEQPPPIYKLGDIALKDLRTDRHLLVKDKRATEKRMEEAARKVLPVYDYYPTMLQEVEASIDSAFTILKRKEAEQKQIEEIKAILGIELSRSDFQVLKSYRYNERSAKYLVSLLSPLVERGIISDKGILIGEEGIIVRNIQTGEERIIRDVGSLLDYQDAKAAVVRAIEEHAERNIPPELKRVMARIIANLISPTYVFNRDETDRRRKIERALVKPVFFSIEKGEILLRKGERITEESLLKVEALREQRRYSITVLMTAGLFLLIALFLASIYLFSTKNIKKINLTNKDILFCVIVLITSLVLTRVAAFIAEVLSSTFTIFPLISYYYFFPIAAGAMLVRIVLNSEVALVYSVVNSLSTGLLLGEGIVLPAFYLTGSVIGAHSVARCDQRTRLIKGGILVAMANVLFVTFSGMSTENLFSSEVTSGIVLGFVGGIVSGVITVGVAPIVETIFGYTTDIKLLELANLDHPILKEMLVKAPGTYHHSMMVGNLAEQGARAIGVNPLLARVSAYYHDIGKITKPQYFIENQMSGNNRHDKLTPSMSSLILVSHVKDGVEIANEHKLGNKIIDIIKQHHGTRLINFFYQKAKEQQNAEMHEVDECDFRYLGPKPQTKEAGIVMLADAVEAASRALDDPTPARIKGLVQKIVNEIFIDGQLDECELTLKDLNAVAKSFTIALNAIYHHRIEYPEGRATGATQKNGGSSPKQTKEAKGKAIRGKEASRKDIAPFGTA